VCDSTCSKCNGPNSTNCLECSGETYLFDGECWSECPLGSFIYENKCQGIFLFVSFFFINFKKKNSMYLPMFWL